MLHVWSCDCTCDPWGLWGTWGRAGSSSATCNNIFWTPHTFVKVQDFATQLQSSASGTVSAATCLKLALHTNSGRPQAVPDSDIHNEPQQFHEFLCPALTGVLRSGSHWMLAQGQRSSQSLSAQVTEAPGRRLLQGMHQSCPPSSRSQQHSPLAVVQQPVLATLTLQQNTRTPVLRRKPIKGLEARQNTSNSLVLNMTSLPIRFTTSATADRSVGQCLKQ